MDEVKHRYGGATGLAKASAVVSVFTGGLSFVGSCILLREVVADHHARKGNSIARLLMSLSIADLIFSMGTMMSTFASPSHLDYVHGNIGTTQTCELQGFLLVLGYIASPIFNLALSYFYLLIVRYNYPDQALRKLECGVQSVLWATALSVAVVPLPLNMYNNAYDFCWVKEYPIGCDTAIQLSDVTCERGPIAPQYEHIIAFIPLWPCLTMSAVVMALLYLSVRDVENRMSKYTGHQMAVALTKRQSLSDTANGFNSVDRQRSRSVAIQAAFYIMAFLFTYGPYLAAMVYDSITGSHRNGLEFVAFNICLPLQGFFNCYIFIRLREMQTAEGRFFKKILFCQFLYSHESKVNHQQRETEVTVEPPSQDGTIQAVLDDSSPVRAPSTLQAERLQYIQGMP